MKSILTKTIFLFVVYQIAVLLSGCCKCDKQIYRRYSVNNLAVTNVKYAISKDSSYQILNVDTTAYNNGTYGINLKFSVGKYARLMNAPTFNFTTQAFACKCWSYMKPIDTIAGIRIKTVDDFNAVYSAGDDASSLFTILTYEHQPAKIRYVPLQSLAFEEIQEYSDYYAQYIYLNAVPDTPRDVQFEIEVTLSNGRTFKATTQKVFIAG